jgi:hypothetical protein
MKCKIPKPQPPQTQGKILKPVFVASDDKITFSFSALEKTKHFNIDVTCPSWPSELFDMLKDISNFSKTDLIGGKFPKYRVHNHENASPPDKLPEGVALKDCYQIRISKTKGGIHGVFYDNVFYVIWLDPLHNLYPDDRYGGLRVIRPPKTCCKDRDEIIAQKQAEIERLQKDVKELEDLINSN